MFLNIRKINYKKGVGTSLLGASMIVLAFIFSIVTINYSSVFMHAVKTQMVTDIVADGSTIWGQKAFKVESDKVFSKATELINYNNEIQNSMNYSLVNLDIVDDYSRDGFKDAKVTYYVSGNSKTYIPARGETEGNTLDGICKAVVLSFAYLPMNPNIPEWAEDIYGNALSSVDIDSPQYKAIVESRQYYGWIYSQPMRNSQGYRDCSSFVSSCYYKYTDEIANAGLDTWNLLNDAKNAGTFTYTKKDYSKLFKGIQIGDIIYWEDGKHKRHADMDYVGHVGLYLGPNPNNGKHYFMHASSSKGFVIISELNGYSDNLLIGYSHISYDRTGLSASDYYEGAPLESTPPIY